MFTKIFGYSLLLCLVGLLGIGVYEVYMEFGIGSALVLAVIVLVFATIFAALAEETRC